MSNYYAELEQEIETLLNHQEIEKAYDLVKEELSMPYIPAKFMEKLEAWEKECKVALKIPIIPKIDFEMIRSFILDPDEGLNQAGLSELSKLNLRHYLDEIQKLFTESKSDIVKSMLLLHCIEQEVNHEFNFTKNGFEVEVSPVYVLHPQESEGYQGASQQLEAMTFKEPSLNQLCQQLLVHEVIMALPFSYDENEAKGLALAIYKRSLTLLNRESEWYDYTVENKIKESECLDLFSTL